MKVNNKEIIGIGVNYVYILKNDMYHELASENGASNTISVTYDIEKAIEDLKEQLKNDFDNFDELKCSVICGGFYEERDTFEDVCIELDYLVKMGNCGDNTPIIVSEFLNKNDYENGVDNSVYSIEKRGVK